MIEQTFGFRVLSGEQVLSRLDAVAKQVPSFDALWSRPVHNGWIERKKLPERRELGATILKNFSIVADGSVTSEVLLARSAALPDAVVFSTIVSVGKEGLSFIASREGGRWFIGYADGRLTTPTAEPFLRTLADDLRWPFRFTSDSIWDIAHSADGSLLPQLPQALKVELPAASIDDVLRFGDEYVRKFGPGAVYGWTGSPAKDASPDDVSTAYDAILAADLPIRSITLNYEFAAADLESIARLQDLCAKSSDVFTVKLGSFQGARGLTIALEDEIKKKGHKLSLVCEIEDADEDDQDVVAEFRKWVRELQGTIGK